MTQPLILSIDCGTQSIRASLVDSRGNFIALEKIPITPYFSKNPGWAEQEAEVFWKTLCSATKRLLAQKPTLKKYIQGVTVTTQRSTLVNLDKNGKPLRPAMIWLDRRKAHLEKWPPLWLKILLQAINFLGAAQYAYTECEANWLRQEQPEIWDKTHKFLFLSGYLNYMLSGEFIDSTASIVGYVPFNYKTHTWAKKNDLKWKMFPMAKSILPQLAPPSAIIGQISRKAARDTGIPAGLPLVASGGDKATEILGAGCTNPETACLSFGTTATINTTQRHPGILQYGDHGLPRLLAFELVQGGIRPPGKGNCPEKKYQRGRDF
jgi:sugar (pentulose or hexulose) kinase